MLDPKDKKKKNKTTNSKNPQPLLSGSVQTDRLCRGWKGRKPEAAAVLWRDLYVG